MRFSMVINIRLTSDGLVQMFLFTLTTSLRPVALVYNSLLLSRVVIKRVFWLVMDMTQTLTSSKLCMALIQSNW